MKKLMTALMGGILAATAFAIPDLVPFPQQFKPGEGVVVVPSLESVPAKILPAGSRPPEGYVIRVTRDKGAAIVASDAAGAFYARETLKQLATKTAAGFEIPCCDIRDFPAFGWRGIMWDDCRHFFGKEAIKKTMDAMAAHKLNVFHWHLTDDQGWRLEIPQYPALVKYGAVRPESEYPDGLGKNRALDPTPYGPYYYTAADVKEVLAYAAARHIRVIPEIELPGHAVAAVAAYPEFCCRGQAAFGGRDHGVPRAQWGVSDDVFCAGNDGTVKFLENVLDYVCTLFPDSVVHIGGDEAPKGRWKECPKCQARIKALGLKDEAELQGWVTRHFTDYLAKKGRRAIGWDEITEVDLPAETMVMNWHGAGKGIAAARAGHDVVFSPTSHCYFDYRPCAPEILAAKGYGHPTWSRELKLEKVYSLNPLADIPDRYRKHVIGVQGNLWAESIVTPAEAEWKLWPRAAALAEIGWTGAGKFPFADFKRRCDADMKRMSNAGYNVMIDETGADAIINGVHGYMPDNYVVPKEPAVRERLEWFKDQKLALMMHFGMYSQMGIFESWALCDREEAWSRVQIDWTDDAETFKRQYWNLWKSFNPVRFQPKKWARLAKDNGFRYLIFTTKHHDGFCLFDTKYTDFKVTNPACPFSKDPRADIVRNVFDAFRAEGLGIAAYFSKPDWHNEDYWENHGVGRRVTRMPTYDVKANPEKWAKFRAFTKNQIVELVRDYGPVDVIWLDGGQVQRKCGLDIGIEDIVAEARKYNPGLISADRTAGGSCENVITPEQQVPPQPLAVPWESCITMGTGFSYRYDDEYKSPRELVHLLLDVIAKGGNLALNVAPGPDGRLPQPAIARMEALGAWLGANGKGVYATRPIAPFAKDDWRFTGGKDGKTVYAFRLWKAGEGDLLAQVIPCEGPEKVAGVKHLATGIAVPFKVVEGGLSIRLPETFRTNPYADGFSLTCR